MSDNELIQTEECQGDNFQCNTIPSRQATDSVIIKFLENRILSRFGCPRKIIIENAVAFGSKKMVEFCHKYQITFGHSTAYYPQGNGLAEFSNKSLVKIIKTLLEDNKKSWHNNLVHALWADRLTIKKSIVMSPYQLVYGVLATYNIWQSKQVAKFGFKPSRNHFP